MLNRALSMTTVGTVQDPDSDEEEEELKSSERNASQKRPIFPPNEYICVTNLCRRKVKYELSITQQIFVTLEDPNSSFLATVIGALLMGVILLSTIVYIISTDPSQLYIPSSCSDPACNDDPNLCPNEMICEPEPKPWLYNVETACVLVFLVDYVFRVASVATIPARMAGVLDPEWDMENAYKLPVDPPYSRSKVVLLYMLRPMCIIDLIAIVPFFLDFIKLGKTSSFSVIRVLRLARVLRIAKSGKYSQSLMSFATTLKESVSALSILVFLTILGVVLFGALEFFFERGEYTVDSDYPEGAYLRPNKEHTGKEVSPFNSIGTAMYWATVTITTLGYGDIYPTTTLGRLCSCVWSLCGIICIALPVTVLGTNFMEIITKVERERQEKLEAIRNNLEIETTSSLNAMNGQNRSEAQKSLDKTSGKRQQRRSAPAVLDRGRSVEKDVVNVDDRSAEDAVATSTSCACDSSRTLKDAEESRAANLEKLKRLSLQMQNIASEISYVQMQIQEDNRVIEENYYMICTKYQ